MLIIGLTGGIGSGKSAVAERFAALGVPVIDADQVARDVVARGQPALTEIAEHFGTGVLNPDGTLDRRAFRDRVFEDEAARKALEGILHPRIRAEMARRAAALDAAYVILSIPLLLEAGQAEMVDRVLVVDCPEELQVRRVCARDDVTPEQARAILAAQCSREERLARADDVIDNGGLEDALGPQVEQLHRDYLRLAAGRA